MDLASAKQIVKSGDVLAWTDKLWASWYDFQVEMVRVFTQSEYCHVGIALMENGSLYVLESVSTGVQKRLVTDGEQFYIIPSGSSWTPASEAAAMSKMGQPYSKVKACLSLFYKFTPGAGKYWECAEYVRYCLSFAGVDIDCKNTPALVVEWLQDNDGSAVDTVTTNGD